MAFRVTRGPFLLGAVNDLHLNKYSEEPEETTEYTRDIIENLRKSFTLTTASSV